VNILLLNSIGKKKWGGGEKWMLLAASGLIERGHKVVIGCKKNSMLYHKATDSHIPTVIIPIHSDFSLLGFTKLFQFVKNQAIDVIIGCQNRDVRLSGLVKMFMSKPIVISRQGVQLIKRNLKYRLSFAPLCDGMITNTYSIKSEYDSYGWWDDEFVKVIYNGVELDLNNNSSYDFSLHIQSSIESPQIILSIGRYSAQKGYSYLLDAARKICQINDKAYFFIAGEGRERSSMQSYIKKHGLENRVFLLGFVTNTHALLRGADLFVLPSLYEGMPNVILEAMIAGVPVIATNVNGTKELIKNGITGELVPPKDSAALFNAIQSFLTDKVGTSFVDEAKRAVENEFSVSYMIDNIERYLLSKIKSN